MIFTPEHCELIKQELKTHTRRLKYPHHHFAVGNQLGMKTIPDRVYERFSRYHSRLKWEVGRTYAVCPGRGKHQVARIRLLGIRDERIQDISYDDIRAEGIKRTGPAPIETAYLMTGTTDISELKFHLFRAEFAALWDGINKKAGKFWSDNPEIWVLAFELCESPKAGET